MGEVDFTPSGYKKSEKNFIEALTSHASTPHANIGASIKASL